MDTSPFTRAGQGKYGHPDDNLADALAQFDRYEEACTVVRDGLAQSRRVGNRYWELSFLGQLYPFFAAGEWDEALAMFAELPIDEWEQSRAAFVVGPLVAAGIGVRRGTLDEGRLVVERFRAMATSGDVYEKAASNCAHAFLLLDEGDLSGALATAPP